MAEKLTGGIMKIKLIAVLLCLFCLSGIVMAQSSDESAVRQETQFSINTDPSKIQLNAPSTPNQQPQIKAPSTFGLFVRMFFMLAVVAGIAYVVFYFLKKSTKISNDSDPFLRRVSQITLSPGKSVQVITLQDNAYLIGVSDQNISLLGQVEDKELVNAMNLYSDKSQKVSKPRSFREILDIFMPGSSSEKEENIYGQSPVSPADAIKRQRERLNSDTAAQEGGEQ